MNESTNESQVPARRTCGTMPVHHRLMLQDPAYAEARARIENLTFDFALGRRRARWAGTVHIPVVVHVVWNMDRENISEDQIRSQIAVLNEDYRALNADLEDVPSAFEGRIGNPQIEFALASVDPDGNPTTGITRTRTSTTSFGHDDRVKSSATGGADPWPSDQYLNIWTCELAGGLLGYAQFPGGAAATDGVVILHSAFGTTGTAASPFDLGRTTTHEVGHWLNLRHIWGDDDGGCSGSDFVSDTPNQAGPNYGCPGFPHVSCSNGPDGDMFMNYMDYVDDHCMVMFSAGQVVRIQAALEGPRSSFIPETVSTTWLPPVLHVMMRGPNEPEWLRPVLQVMMR